MTYPTPEEASRFAKGLVEAHERMTGGLPDAPNRQAARTPIRNIDSTPFSIHGDDCLMVKEGVKITALLEQVLCFIGTADVVIAPVCQKHTKVFAASYLLSLSQGMLESVLKTLNLLERPRQG
jgi:hypothetical protein